MAKINIPFDNTNYSIDESAISDASAALKSHLQTVMSGSGATINLGGVIYNVDSAKLTAATNAFIAHLGTVAGSGKKVVVNGVEYGIDSAKMASAVTELHTVLGGLHSDDGDGGSAMLYGNGQEYYTMAPTSLTFRSTEPLNEFQEVKIDGQIIDSSNYTLEEGSTIVTLSIDYLKTLQSGNYRIDVKSANNTVGCGFSVVEPVLKENNLYYNQPYCAYVDMMGWDVVFFVRDDETIDTITIVGSEYSTSTATYAVDGNSITIVSDAGTFTGTISADGMGIYCNELAKNFVLGDEKVVADKDYIYIYIENLGGYEATCIDKTKSCYDDIRTGINGIDTVSLAISSFAYNDNLVSAPIIPDSVKIIGEDAFKFCSNLTSVVIPYGVTTIGAGAFVSCIGLTSIDIPDSVTNIGESAFSGCNMTNITLPAKLSNIETGLFSQCRELISVTIPSSVTSIGKSAFEACYNLIDITFEGTIAQWNAIEKLHGDVHGWQHDVPATHISCSDGNVAL